MAKRLVSVTQLIEVDMDDSKFDAAFMAEFMESFYPYDTHNEHACHLAQMYARGVADDTSFIEGYGNPKEMGIKFRYVDGSEEVEDSY